MTTTWINISKPSVTSWTTIPKATGSAGTGGGSPIGLLLSLTYAAGGATWTTITKPTGTSWTTIPKAT